MTDKKVRYRLIHQPRRRFFELVKYESDIEYLEPITIGAISEERIIQLILATNKIMR